MKKTNSFSTIALHVGLTAFGLAFSSSADAATLYWNQSSYRVNGVTYTLQFNTAASWSTDAAGTSASPAAPTIADNLIFNSTPNNSLGGSVAIESGNAFANSLTFNTSGTGGTAGTPGTTLAPNSGRTLTLGSGGITLNSGSGTVTFGSTSQSFPIEVTTDQDWVNHSGSTLTVRRLRASDTATGPVGLTLNAAGSGNISLSSGNNGITDSVDTTRSLALVVASTGTGEVVTGGGSTYTGGVTVRRGVLRANSTLGASTGEVKLGDNTGSEAAKLRLNSTVAYANTLNVQAGNSGTNTLEFMNTGGGSWSGAVTLNNTLNVAVISGGSGAQINGPISGTGNLVKSQYNGGNSGTLTLTAINTYEGNTTVSNGTLILADDAALTFTIDANGVNNRIDGSGTLTLNGDFIFDLSGAAAVDGNLWNIVTVGTLSETFGSTFTVQGFDDSDNNNIWTNGGWSFSEATGNLSYTAIPEPTTTALLAGFGFLLFATSRRRDHSLA